ncbi:MAG TPA: TolC family protein [Bryobacteraceae bacterium]|nr:TolC family protein [Bryobacteraceae bacterium]
MALWLVWAAFCRLEAQQPLTLAEAHDMALRTHPQISSSSFTAQALREVVREVRSSLQPNVTGSVTGVGADPGSRIAAGALNNPVLYNRLGTGITVTQLVSDFGRTGELVASAKLRADAADQNIEAVRAGVLLRVDRAYFSVLRAQSVLKVAEQTVAARQLIVDQVSALVASKLKSNLDLSFANVNLADAKLLLVSAGNDVSASSAELATTLGSPEIRSFALTEQPMPEGLEDGLEALIQEGIQKRPELASLRLEENAAQRFARAERALQFPTVSAIGAAGFAPVASKAVPGTYGGLGVNLNIPLFNGGLFSARRTEAELRARAVGQNVKDIENSVARDIRVAFLNARTAFERVALTQQLRQQTQLSLDLAQSRYDLGLGSIIELSQAQLNVTAAQIAGSSAKYDYQTQRSVLAYQIGALR